MNSTLVWHNAAYVPISWTYKKVNASEWLLPCTTLQIELFSILFSHTTTLMHLWNKAVESEQMDIVFSPQTVGITVAYKYREENRNSNLYIQKEVNFQMTEKVPFWNVKKSI